MTPDRRFNRQRYDRARSGKLSRKWYRSAAWKAKARAQLDEEPTCRACRNLTPRKISAAELADHIEPHREDFEKFWRGELQSLCWSCHSGPKQSEEVRGYSATIDPDSGWPADPRHPFNKEPI